MFETETLPLVFTADEVLVERHWKQPRLELWACFVAAVVRDFSPVVLARMTVPGRSRLEGRLAVCWKTGQAANSGGSRS